MSYSKALYIFLLQLTIIFIPYSLYDIFCDRPFIRKEASQGLEGWVNCEEFLLLLHRAQVWLLAPTSGGSQLPVTPV